MTPGEGQENRVQAAVSENEGTEVDAELEQLNDQMRFRRGKLQALRAAGNDPFMASFKPTHHADEIKENFASLEGHPVAVAGRLMLLRSQGKLSFGDLQDASGRIQLFVRQDVLGEEAYKAFRGARPGRHYRRVRPSHEDPPGRNQRSGGKLCAACQGTAAAAGKMARLAGRRAKVSLPLSRLDHESGIQARFCDAQPHHSRDPQFPRRTRLHRS